MTIFWIIVALLSFSLGTRVARKVREATKLFEYNRGFEEGFAVAKVIFKASSPVAAKGKKAAWTCDKCPRRFETRFLLRTHKTTGRHPKK